VNFLNANIRRLASGVLFRLFDADRILDKALQRVDKRLVFAWVRGLGDVAFILNEFSNYIQEKVPDAEVSALVRPGLEEACGWIEGIKKVITVKQWSREMTLESMWGLAFPSAWEIKRVISSLGLQGEFDRIIPYPLGRWYDREPRKRRPYLKWTEKERQFGERFIQTAFPEEPKFVVSLNTHTGTENFYDFSKEWGIENFRQLISRILETIPGSHIILVDAHKTWEIPMNSRLLDVRGTFSVSQSLSVIASSDLFICLDAGVVNLLYFLQEISLKILVLLGKTFCFTPLRYPPASSNLHLIPIFGKDEDIHKISPYTVLDAVQRTYKRLLEEKNDFGEAI
jgi:ADP-heptose:LPS heptosyltransferase